MDAKLCYTVGMSFGGLLEQPSGHDKNMLYVLCGAEGLEIFQHKTINNHNYILRPRVKPSLDSMCMLVFKNISVQEEGNTSLKHFTTM